MTHANDAANAPHPMAHHCDKLLHRIHELVWQMVQTGGVVIAIQSQYGYMMASAASSSSFWTAKQKQQQPPSTMSLGLQASSSCSLSSNSLTSSPSSCTGDEDEEDDNNEVIGGTCCVMGTPGANFLSTGSCTMARITTQSMLDQHDKMLVFSLFQYLLACTIAMTPRQYSHCVWCHHQSFHHGYGPFSAQVALWIWVWYDVTVQLHAWLQDAMMQHLCSMRLQHPLYACLSPPRKSIAHVLQASAEAAAVPHPVLAVKKDNNEPEDAADSKGRRRGGGWTCQFFGIGWGFLLVRYQCWRWNHNTCMDGCTSCHSLDETFNVNKYETTQWPVLTMDAPCRWCHSHGMHAIIIQLMMGINFMLVIICYCMSGIVGCTTMILYMKSIVHRSIYISQDYICISNPVAVATALHNDGCYHLLPGWLLSFK